MILNFDSLVNKYRLYIKGVIHIGAYIGEEYENYNDHRIKNMIFFEPVSRHFSILSDKVAAARSSLHQDSIHLENKALGNENKMIDMNISEGGGGSGASSSVLKPKLHLKLHDHITFPSTEKVEMIRLDDYWALNDKTNQNAYNFINIDVQGYELEVFKGAANTLKNIDYVISEVNKDEVYEGCAQIEELDTFLSQFGFERVEVNWAGGAWGDAFYIKRNS